MTCLGTVTLYCHTFQSCMGMHGAIWSRHTRSAKVHQGSIRLDTVGVSGSNPLSRTIFVFLQVTAYISKERAHFRAAQSEIDRARILPSALLFCALLLCFKVELFAQEVFEVEQLEEAKAQGIIVFAPTPKYPEATRKEHITGAGVVELKIDTQTGFVTSAKMIKSTGHKILDDSALETFQQWRFKSRTVVGMKVPVNFIMPAAKSAHSGASAANTSLPEIRKVINAPRPEYPYDARAKRWTGSGIVLMEVESRTGYVTSAGAKY